MLRLILFLILLYFLLRYFRSLIPKRQGPAAQQNASKNRFGAQSRRPGAPPKVVDEMKPCPQCGTYNPTRLAYPKKELYFCDERCHEAFVRRKQSL